MPRHPTEDLDRVWENEFRTDRFTFWFFRAPSFASYCQSLPIHPALRLDLC